MIFNDGMTPYKLHILVCNDSDCASKGSQQLYDKLKELINAKNLRDEVKVSKSTCLDDCENGPNILVYPKAILYSNVASENLEKILDAHLKDKYVPKLRHSKMLK